MNCKKCHHELTEPEDLPIIELCRPCYDLAIHEIGRLRGRDFKRDYGEFHVPAKEQNRGNH